MELLAVLGFMALFHLFSRGQILSLDESTRKLKSHCLYLRAMIEDLETTLRANKMAQQQGQKRKREDEHHHLYLRIAHGREVLDEAQSLLSQLEQCCPQQKRQARAERVYSEHIQAKIDAVQVSIDGLADLPTRHAGHGPSLGHCIPVGDLIGQVAWETMGALKALLLDPKAERIAIHGMKGIGKTLLMKYLHNFAVVCTGNFDNVFWVTCPHEFSIRHLQDAIAAALECDLSDTDDLILRAEELSEIITALGTSVIFLDAVPAANISLQQIGIPVPSDGTFCKLVITTRSTLVCRLLECTDTAEVDPLPEDEALQLFMQVIGIDEGHVYLLRDIPRLIAKQCCGVPSTIVDRATQMRSIYDIREWRHKLAVGLDIT